MKANLIHGTNLGTYILITMPPAEAEGFIGIADFIKEEATEDKRKTMRKFEQLIKCALTGKEPDAEGR